MLFDSPRLTALSFLMLMPLLAADPPPHPGEPQAHRDLVPGKPSTSARLYAREHPEGPPRVEPVYVQPVKADQWELVIPKAHPAGAEAIVTVSTRDGAVLNGSTLAPKADNFFHYTSTYRLQVAKDRLSGSLRIRFLDKKSLNAQETLTMGVERVVILDVQVKSGQVSGTGELLGVGAARTPLTIRGKYFAGGRPERPEDTIAAGAGWPGHRGPFGNGAAEDRGCRLLADLAQARPVWKCTEDLPDGRAHTSGGGPMGPILGDKSCVDWLRHAGSKSGPVVADGLVYLYTMIPSGQVGEIIPDKRFSSDVFDQAVLTQAAHDWLPGVAAKPGPPEEPGLTDSAKPRFYPQRTMFCVGADDVIFCFEAATGQLRWKTVYPAASANYGGSKGGPHLSAFVANGKVYALGSTERIYCLDAKTGKEIWQSSTGWSATAKYKILQECLAAKTGFPRNRSLETSLVVAEGVVVVCDQRGKLHQKDGYAYTEGPGLIGLDAATGKKLWQTAEGITSDSVTPCRWVHQGKTYILVNGSDKLRALDPISGKFLWEVPCGPSGMSLVADQDYAVANTGDAKQAEVSGFRITPKGAEKIWSLPKNYQIPRGYFYPVIYRGHLYAIGGESALICVRLSDGKVVAAVKDLGGGHSGGGDSLIAGEGRTIGSGLCVTGVEENTKPLHAPWRVAFAIGYFTPLDTALVDGRFFLRDKTGIVCYDLRDAGAAAK